jgi:hypothetical protein
MSGGASSWSCAWEVEWKTQDSDETDLLCWGAPGLNLGNGEFDVDIMEENV